MLLVLILLAFEAHRSRRARLALVVTVIAFAVPQIVLRTMYPAPFVKWAWWDMVFANVPFLQRSMYEFSLTIKNNIKVALFYNVFWIWAARVCDDRRSVRETSGCDWGGLPDAGLSGDLHSRAPPLPPLAIVVLPLAVNAIEQRSAGSGSSARRVP
jgi:hypothetical protein